MNYHQIEKNRYICCNKIYGRKGKCFCKKQIEEGRQCYIVCPLVEENEEINAKAVLELVEKYKNETFKEYKVECIYGKMKSKEKDEIMLNFKEGKSIF